MQISKIFLSGSKIILLPLMILGFVELKAAQGFSYISAPFEARSNAGAGVVQNPFGVTEEDMIVAAEESEAPLVSKKVLPHQSPSKPGKLNGKVENDKPAKNIVKSKMSLRKEFKEGEDFHKKWFNMSLPDIKNSLGKLTSFCKKTCTKNLCMDKEIANNCHLICPESTTEDCPDPLKQNGGNSLGSPKSHNINEDSGSLDKLNDSFSSEEDPLTS